MAKLISTPNFNLPWSSKVGDDKRYWKILAASFLPFLLLSVVIPGIIVPEKNREDLEKLPPQLARVVLEEKKIPPPPPPPPEPEPEPEPEIEEPEEEPKEEKPPEPEPEPKKEEPKPVEPEPAKLVEEAKEAAEAEINEFADALSDMREAFELDDVSGDELSQAGGEAAELDRSIIASQASAGSGGIDTQNLSRDTGGIALSGKTSTRVKSKLPKAKATKDTAEARATRDKSYRSDEDIRKVMDQKKSAVFSVYNRALRKDPTLEGKVVFKIVIDANGKVSSAEILSSELDNPELEKKLLSRIRTINFGARDVLQTTLNYSFDFLPY